LLGNIYCDDENVAYITCGVIAEHIMNVYTTREAIYIHVRAIKANNYWLNVGQVKPLNI
jgi:hypothetical protein